MVIHRCHRPAEGSHLAEHNRPAVGTAVVAVADSTVQTVDSLAVRADRIRFAKVSAASEAAGGIAVAVAAIPAVAPVAVRV